MSLGTRLQELTDKHRSLERKIADELNRPAADSGKLTRWKREKLKLKEEIVRLDFSTRH